MFVETQSHTVTEIGLRLPDGTLIFPPNTWHGRGLETPEDRRIVFDAIEESGKNLGMPTLTQHYAWYVHDKEIITLTRSFDGDNHDLDDPNIVADTQVNTTASADFDDDEPEWVPPAAVDTGL